jgi:CDP-diacylglycerol--glycerol-3-phosphate 3-phosphatidyltransferase
MRYYPCAAIRISSCDRVEYRELAQGASSVRGSGSGAPVIGRADLTTLPNIVSLSRIVGVAAAVLFYFAGYPRVFLVLGTAACLTDYLDGYLARRLSQESVLGAMLDQAADSFTTGIALALLVVAGGFPFVFLVIFLGREFWVATVRRYAAINGLEIPSHVSGKLATGFIYWSMLLMAVVLILDIPAVLAAWLSPVAMFGMTVGLTLSCVAGWRYTRSLAGAAR